jgi:hypothetical protein
VRTVVLGPRPPELEAVLERRRALGQDLYDEVWAGEYHMAPAPSHRHAPGRRGRGRAATAGSARRAEV